MASSGMAATVARRGRFIHQSTHGYPGLHGCAMGTRDLGRNKAKRLLRAGRPRKHWRTLARAG